MILISKWLRSQANKPDMPLFIAVYMARYVEKIEKTQRGK